MCFVTQFYQHKLIQKHKLENAVGRVTGGAFSL